MQVEKFLSRYETLVKELGEAKVRASWRDAEKEIAEEFLAHARAIREEIAAAAREGRPARVVELLQSWGGSTIAYRKRMIDSPSYTLNHEEIEKALEEGIRFAEGAPHAGAAWWTPRAPEGHWWSPRCRRCPARRVLPAHTVLVACDFANTVGTHEDAAHFELDGWFFAAVDDEGNPVKPEKSAKPANPNVLLSRDGGALRELLRRPASLRRTPATS